MSALLGAGPVIKVQPWWERLGPAFTRSRTTDYIREAGGLEVPLLRNFGDVGESEELLGFDGLIPWLYQQSVLGVPNKYLAYGGGGLALFLILTSLRRR